MKHTKYVWNNRRNRKAAMRTEQANSRRGIEVMLLTVVMNRQVIAVLKLPLGIEDKIRKIETIYNKCTSNAWFPAGTFKIAIADCKTHWGDLDTAQEAVTARTGTATTRNDKLKIVKIDLVSTMADVQRVANLNVENSEAIIRSAGFDVKGITPYDQPEVEARDKKNEAGTVTLISKSAGRGVQAAYEWQMSINGTQWTALPAYVPSTVPVVEHEVSGLTIGTKYYFRRRIIIGRTAQQWSQVVFVVVG